ncbi:cache domain-containing protein [Microcoleus sp. LAD1_D5]|uniref:cache domain-containing protein n=1 Tax=unclassified Microcoleus TaxID=2642155 RepID=UPI002FD5E2B4
MINNFFPKMQPRLLLLLILITLTLVSIFGWYGTSSSTEALQNLALITLSDSVNSTANQMINKFENLRADILFLRQTPPVLGIIRTQEGNGGDKKTNSTYKEWVERMQVTFLSMMEAKPYYMQLRYIYHKGKDIVRLDSDGTNINVIPDSKLQSKADRDYFLATMKLQPGQVYVSSLNLNQEGRKIKIPYKPTIRYATPIFNAKGERQSLLISNALGSTLIDMVKNFTSELSDKSFILNQDGYYLAHPTNPKKAWGVDLKTHEKIKKDFSSDILAKAID